MYDEIARALTDSIDDITRRWVEDLRQNPRTDIHKQLLSAEIVDGVKGMLAGLAGAIGSNEMPDGETLPLPLVSETRPTNPVRIRSTRPLGGPLAQARISAASLGRLRHRQGYEIQEVLYEFVKIRQEAWTAIRGTSLPPRQRITLDVVAYIDRLLDELMLTAVENFYNTSVRDLERRAIRDPLTQIYNKDFFYQRLNEELRRAIRYAQPISVVMLDLDSLKSINDTYGHAAGDEAIKAVANSIADTCRQSDLPCRFGGDEFAVILPETSKAQARAFAQRVMNAVQKLGPLVVLIDPASPVVEPGPTTKGSREGREEEPGKGPLLAPSPLISIGLASFPEDARNPETLLARADEALYRAKGEGRNRIVG